MAQVKLTKRVVDAIEPPAAGQAFHRDSLLPGFALRVTAGGAKSFTVEKRIRGRLRRTTLGRYGPLTVEEARVRAQRFLSQVADGRDPLAEKKAHVYAGVTLGEVFERYLKIRTHLKPNTVDDYRRLMREVFGDWQTRPLTAISKDMIQGRHATHGERSHSRANNAMRLLKALFNYARGQYDDAEGRSLYPENPVDRLSHIRAWYPIPRKRTLIKKYQLPAWFDAVESLRTEGDPTSDTMADYLFLLIFTGLRRSEGMRLTWDDIDFTYGTLSVNDTKNKEPLILPLSGFLVDLLGARLGRHESMYVFPNATGGHLGDPRKQMNKVVARSEVPFTLHDLRRTFITIAESLELSQYAIKHLVNHKIPNDVTAGYIVMDPERLRQPMERITQAILSAAGRAPVAVEAADNVVPISQAG